MRTYSGPAALAFGLLVAASGASAQFMQPDTFGWSRGDADSAWFEWDVFTSATGGNLPDVGQFPDPLPEGWATPDVYDISGYGLISGSGNIYSFMGIISIEVVIPNYNYGTGSTTLLLQLRTQGNEIDYGSLHVGGVAPVEHLELGRESLGEFGWIVDALFRFELEGNDDVYIAAFDAADLHVSIDRVAVDTFARAEECIADFNGDTVVNTIDFIDFLNAWVAGDGSADINGDTVVDTRDVILFLNLWVEGC